MATRSGSCRFQRRIVWRGALLDQRAKGAAVLGKHADHKAQSVVLEREHAVDHVDAVFGPAVRALGPVRPMHLETVHQLVCIDQDLHHTFHHRVVGDPTERWVARSWILSRCHYRLRGIPLEGRARDDVWYFAFGANMHDSAFRERRGMCPLEWRAARVRGYRLRFNLDGRPKGKAAPANLSICL